MDKFGVAPECAGAESEGVQILRAVFNPSMMVNVQADAQGHKRGRAGVATLFCTIPMPCKRPHTARHQAGDQHRPPSTITQADWNSERADPVARQSV